MNFEWNLRNLNCIWTICANLKKNQNERKYGLEWLGVLGERDDQLKGALAY